MNIHTKKNTGETNSKMEKMGRTDHRKSDDKETAKSANEKAEIQKKYQRPDYLLRLL